MTKHIVTIEDLILNPSLVEQDIKVGDEITFSGDSIILEGYLN